VQCSLQQIQDEGQVADLDRTSYNSWFHPTTISLHGIHWKEGKEQVVLTIVDFVYTNN